MWKRELNTPHVFVQCTLHEINIFWIIWLLFDLPVDIQSVWATGKWTVLYFYSAFLSCQDTRAGQYFNIFKISRFLCDISWDYLNTKQCSFIFGKPFIFFLPFTPLLLPSRTQTHSPQPCTPSPSCFSRRWAGRRRGDV